jgi:ABC-type branched-subunit amino acid transport system permease subunit
VALAFLMLISFANSAIGAPRPGESCFDATAPPSGVADVCTDVNDPDVPAGGGSLDLGLLLPILGAAVGGAALALVLGYLFIRRRGDLPVEPAVPGEWWTCKHCGCNNVIGSARCYACGTWQG